MYSFRKFGVMCLAGILLAGSPLAATVVNEEAVSSPIDAPKQTDVKTESLNRESPEPKKQQPEKPEQNKPVKPAKPSQHGGLFIDMVQLPSGIYVGKYEITQGQWKQVMGKNPAVFIGCGDNCPVEVVSWEDVQRFIKELNKQTGKNYRLPTVNEWLGACQAGQNSNEYCGSGDIGAIAWYKGNSAGSTHPVGQKKPNAYGLYDMSGNVSEWTSSCNEGKCSRREYLGGSWLDEPALVSTNPPPRNETTYRGYLYLGLRLVLDP